MHPDNEKDTCCSKPMSVPTPLKFAECGIEEQVKRLHQVIQELRRSLHWSYDAQNKAATKIYALEHHQHSEKGDCMIRIEDTNRDGNGISGGVSSSIDILA